MRDNNKPIEYWDDFVSYRQKRDFDDAYFAKYEKTMEKSDHCGPLNRLYELYTEGWMDQVNYRYCRGDELSAIRSEVIDEGINRYKKIVGELEIYRGKMELTQTMIVPRLVAPHQLQSIYTLLSWLVCFDVDAKIIKGLVPYIAPEGEDRIVDEVLSRYQPEREIAESVVCPRTHRLLHAMFDSDEKKRVKLATQYLERWGKLMSTLKGLKALGGADRAEGAKSNADLAKFSEKPTYMGFWAWDLALMVRILDIDDSSFANHELYPADLAHFKFDGSAQSAPSFTSQIKTQEPINKTQITMLPELLIVFTLSSPDAAPAFSHDIFVDPLSSGEYYVHVEASKASLHSEHENKIDDGLVEAERIEEGLAQFEVLVNFEPHILKLAQEEIEASQSQLSNPGNTNYESDKKWLGVKTADEVLDAHGRDDIARIPIAQSGNTTMWLEATTYHSGYVAMEINYRQIEGDRVLAIRGRVVSDEVTVDVLKKKVDELVESYRHLPMQRYTGAVVE